MAERNSEEVLYRKYVVHFHEDDSSTISYKDFTKLREGVQSLADNPLVKDVEILTKSEEGNVVSSFINGGEKLVPLRGATEFDERYEVIAPVGSGAEIGSDIQIGGKKFVVIGESSYSSWIVAYEDINNLDFDVGTIYIVSEKRYNAQDDTMLQLISEYFPEANIRGPSNYMQSNASLTGMYIVLMCIGYLVETISFTALLHYIMNSGTKENVASAFVGAPPARITCMIYAEGFFLSSGPIFIAIVIHVLLYNSVFAQYNFYNNISYDMKDYLFIMIAMAVLIGIVLGGFSIRYHKKTVIDLKKECMCKG